MINRSTKYVTKKTEDFLINRIKTEKANGYFKQGTFTKEIIWGDYSYVIPMMNKRKQNDFKRGLFLFGMVRKDAKNYLKKYGVKLPKRYPQIEYAGDFNVRRKITATDLNHAYWRIAYNLGIIRDDTYTRGLPDEFKSVRLASLSTLGATKKYQIIRNGEITDEVKEIRGDEEMQKVYKLIRYTCYRYMTQVKKMLGDEFIAYKTDCIYYYDTPKNRKLVADFFEKKDLFMKQLV